MTNFWENKNVLVSGDTGFKGSWLSCLLLKLGSKVNGISLKPDSSNVLYNSLIEDKDFKNFSKNKLYSHFDLDIRDDNFRKLILEINPDIIFHLAAQPLVRESYKNPKYTWETNVIGTINLLEGIKELKKCSVIIVTTDKVYKDLSKRQPYKENDYLGGDDPYSSSKSAVELAVQSWRKSFYKETIQISTARAGNVIGGGDWAVDRIVPDTITALINNKNLKLRYPNAVRPWQHVLDPLWGYVNLAEKQINSQISDSFNFGPNSNESISVRELVNKIEDYWGTQLKIDKIDGQLKETDYLSLSTLKAQANLDWHPKWGIDKTIAETVKWYKAVSLGKSSYQSILESIDSYLDNDNL